MFAKRNREGKIVALSQLREDEQWELVAQDAIDLQEFLLSVKSQRFTALEDSDQAMSRVLEDVVNLLVDQGTIRFTDLPFAAQQKLLSRREMRGQRRGMELLDDGDDLKI